MRPIIIIDIKSTPTHLTVSLPDHPALSEHLSLAHTETVEALIEHLDRLDLPAHSGWRLATEEELPDHDLVAEMADGCPGVEASLILDARSFELAPTVEQVSAAMARIAEIAKAIQEDRVLPGPGQITRAMLWGYLCAREALDVLSLEQVREAVYDGYMEAVYAAEVQS
jgi:hypothetical protein